MIYASCNLSYLITLQTQQCKYFSPEIYCTRRKRKGSYLELSQKESLDYNSTSEIISQLRIPLKRI
jgi:hypothetical protein